MSNVFDVPSPSMNKSWQMGRPVGGSVPFPAPPNFCPLGSTQPCLRDIPVNHQKTLRRLKPIIPSLPTLYFPQTLPVSMAKSPSKPEAGANSSSAAEQNAGSAPPSSMSTTNNGVTAVQQAVRGAPYASFTFSNFTQQPSIADLGITLLPNTGPQNGAPSPSLSLVSQPAAPPTALTAPTTAAPGTAASTPLSRRGSARLAAAQGSVEPAAGAKKTTKPASPSKSRSAEDPVPRDDALLTLVSDTRDRQATSDSLIQAIKTDTSAAAERAKRQHEATSRQLTDVIKRLEAQQAETDRQRRDIDRAIDKIGRLESRSGAPADDSLLVNLEADQTLVRQQTNELIDGFGAMRARQESLERDTANLLTITGSNTRSINHLLTMVERIEQAVMPSPSQQQQQPSRRRNAPDSDFDDEHPSSRPRLSIETTRTTRDLPVGVISQPYHTHFPPYAAPHPAAHEPPPPQLANPAWAEELTPDMLSAVVGAYPHLATLSWGPSPSDAIHRLQVWSGLIKGVGIVPKPTYASQPEGMPDNFRLFTFNSHNNLVAFLTAWDRRDDNFQVVVATPSADLAQPRAPSTAALGLLPPRSTAPDNNRGGRAVCDPPPQFQLEFRSQNQSC